MKKSKVFIVDDHPIFRCGLREVIGADGGMEVVGEAGDAASALKLIKSLRPEIVILDLNLPDQHGLSVCREITHYQPPLSVIILTLQTQESSFNAAMDAGASGYLVKENAVQEVIAAIRAITTGNVYFSPSVSRYVLTRRQRISALREKKTGLNALSPTELLILRLISENKSNREIGEALHISPRTVETHRTHICDKLDVHGRSALLRFATEHRSEL